MPRLGEFTKATHAALTDEADLHAPEEHSTDVHDSDVLDTVVKLVAQGFARIKTGSYQGDGTEDQAIEGVGFEPKVVWSAPDKGSEGQNADIHWTIAGYVDLTGHDSAIWSGEVGTRLGRFISLDADGFTVSDDASDADPNKDGETYYYLAMG